MGNTAQDPVDHARTTRKHAGQNIKNTAAMPGLVAIVLAVVSAVVCLFFLANGDADVGVIAAAVAVAWAAAGFGWLRRERRRVRRLEAEYLSEHPGAEPQIPSS
jgi:O-antigen/teichoic acid export membrane protein